MVLVAPVVMSEVIEPFVVVAFVNVALDANKFVIVESVDVRVSTTPVVKWPKTENKLVEVAFVVEAFVEKRFVVVAFANTALVAEKILVEPVKVRAPPMPTSPVIFALPASKFASVVEPAVSVAIFASPKLAFVE